MRMKHDFVAERAAAQHCSELLANGAASDAASDDRDADYGNLAARLGRMLAVQLAPSLGVSELQPQCGQMEKCTGAEFYSKIGPAAANIHLRCADRGVPLLVTLEYGAAQALTEQAFGGEVREIVSALEELPGSAWMVLEDIALQIAQGFADAAEWNGASSVGGTHENAARLNAFGMDDPCLVWPISIKLPGGIELPFQIAAAEEKISANLPRAQTPVSDNDGAAGPVSFDGLPLPMRAVLAEISMPVSRLSRLKPGDFIPFSPRREVPLMIGRNVIARGQVGEVNTEVALSVTHRN